MRIKYEDYIQNRINSNQKDLLNIKDVHIFFGTYDNIMNYDIICKLLSLDKFIKKNMLVLSMPPRKILRRIFPIAYNNMLAVPPYILLVKMNIESARKKNIILNQSIKQDKDNNIFQLLEQNKNTNQIKNQKELIEQNQLRDKKQITEKLDKAIFTIGYITSLASAFSFNLLQNNELNKNLNNILILSEEQKDIFDVRMILIGYLSSLGFQCIELNNFINKDIINEYQNNTLDQNEFKEKILNNLYNINNRYNKKCCKLIYEQFHKLLPLTFLDNEFFHDENKNKMSYIKLMDNILEESGIKFFLNQHKEILEKINNGKYLPLYNNIELDTLITCVEGDIKALELHQKLLFSRQSITAIYMQKLLNSINEKDY